MFCASVVMYLLVRRLQTQEFDNNLVTYAVGALPAIFLGGYLVVNGFDFSVTLKQAAILAVYGIGLSYTGNKFSVLGVKAAPNPGYSLIIQKGYAPYTAIMSVFLFSSELTLLNALAIAVIIIFAALVMVDFSKARDMTNLKWILYSFISFFAFGTLVLVAKYLLNDGMSPYMITFYGFTFAGLAFTVEYVRKIEWRKILSKNKLSLLTLLAIAALNASFNVFMKQAFVDAPNVGYVNVINTSSITAITLLAVVFFGDKLNLQKIIGILGVTAGLVMLFL